jgi:hypothetical protein
VAVKGVPRGQEREVMLDYALHHMKADLFTDLMDMMV